MKAIEVNGQKIRYDDSQISIVEIDNGAVKFSDDQIAVTSMKMVLNPCQSTAKVEFVENDEPSGSVEIGSQNDRSIRIGGSVSGSTIKGGEIHYY